MFGFPSLSAGSDDAFDSIDEFAPEHLPQLGPFLEGYELVRVRVSPMHHRSGAIDEELDRLAAEDRETAELPDPDGDAGYATYGGGTAGTDADAPF